MNTKLTTVHIELLPAQPSRLEFLCGSFDDNLKQIERRLGVVISYKGTHFQIIGEHRYAQACCDLLKDLYIETQPVRGKVRAFVGDDIHLALQDLMSTHKLLEQESPLEEIKTKSLSIKTKRGIIKPRGENQQKYVSNILTNDISFGIGPAGTGKTYLAVACAIEALERQEVRRILLTRPAVEAGEKLGFLPGDLAQKVDPYLRPLYDALFEMLGFEKVEKLIEKNIIEIAPLAYMRGRTLNDAFIILDESQNTTVEQMKMFLTRIGFNSTAVITGDITQVDLPRNQMSGLRHVIKILSDVEDVSFNFFVADDVVRHPVVARIVKAYEKFESGSEVENDKSLIRRNISHSQDEH